MKRIVFYLFGLLLPCLLLINCKKSDHVGPAPQNVQNLKVVAGYGEVFFSWTTPSDSNFLYVSISYTDGSGKFIEQKFSRHNATASIGGLFTKPYMFMVKTVTSLGAVSTAQSITASPQPPAYIIVAQTISIAPIKAAAKLKWTNTTGKTLGIQIQYIDSTGTTQIIGTSTKKNIDSTIINKLKPVSIKFIVTFSDSSGKRSDPMILTTKPL